MANSSLSTRTLTILLSHLFIIYSHHSNFVDGCLVLNGGKVPSFEDYRPRLRSGFRDVTHVISRDLEFSCYGIVTGWAAYSERIGTFNTITFQVWRASEETTMIGCSTTYQLIGSNTFSEVETDSNRLINISSVVTPIQVQPGDVVGFYAGDFISGSSFVSIQNDASENTLSYFKTSVDSAIISTVMQANNCSYFTGTLSGTPVISATVVEQEIVTTRSPTTQYEPTDFTQAQTTTAAQTSAFTFVSTPTTSSTVSTPRIVTELTRMTSTSQPTTAATSNSQSTLYPTTSASEATNTVTEGSNPLPINETIITSDANDISAVTIITDSSTGDSDAYVETIAITRQSTEDANSDQNKKTFPTLLISSIVAVAVIGILVVSACLIIGKCVSNRVHRRERHDGVHVKSLSFKAHDGLNGIRDRSDSHIYCEMSEVFPSRKKDFTESYSDLDHAAVFKKLDCSCKIPSRYSSSATDYEVPVSTFKRSGALTAHSGQQEQKKELENTYETPVDAKVTFHGALLTPADERKKPASGNSHYDTLKPVVEDEYTFMASVPRQHMLQVASDADNLYENVSNN